MLDYRGVVAAVAPELRKFRRQYFSYSVDFNTLGASTTASEDFTTDNDSYFICVALTMVIATAAAGTTEQTYGPARIRITDSASGQQFFANKQGGLQHIHNIFARMGVDGSLQKLLEWPRTIIPGATVITTLENLEATARRYWLAFHGLKVYHKQSPVFEGPGPS